MDEAVKKSYEALRHAKRESRNAKREYLLEFAISRRAKWSDWIVTLISLALLALAFTSPPTDATIVALKTLAMVFLVPSLCRVWWMRGVKAGAEHRDNT